MKLFQTKTKNTVQPTVEPHRTPSKVSCNRTSTEHHTSEGNAEPTDTYHDTGQ